MVEILSIQSEEAVELIESGMHPEWIELINNGFGGIPEGDSLENAIHEVNFPNRATIFIAKDEDAIIGYASVMRYANNDDDKRGKLMRKAMLDLFRFIPEDKFIGVEISSIAVNEKYRGQRIGMRLYQQVVKELNPCFINGFTKNPIAVGARIKALPDYEVFWGGIPLTSDDYLFGQTIQSLYFMTKTPAEAYQITQQKRVVSLQAQDVDIIPTDLVDTSTLTNYKFKIVCDAINEIQRDKGDRTVFAPLICVRKDLISNIREQ
ncbi:GNAT family N-acetyltransferase [Candidatus Dojkabacteria bacterium]|uniref:GNAT family N-acetyltransferase n=1 Tax=Candidatus Dojkabacteria bacterium TaxID=2099670 RepID=A0A955L9I8_9BACT|nr:GNAT family N-acetyltransferase [Candidatus Dojkabacteria bacterium]